MLLIISCGEKYRSKDNYILSIRIDSIPDSLLENRNASLCDTCITTLIVRHEECTECKDIYVDSGIIYLSQKIISDFISSNLNKQRGKSNNKNEYMFSSRLNTKDLYFTNEADLNKLWPTLSDFHKLYRIRGRVTENSGSTLKFDLSSYVLLDSIYARKFIIE